MEHGYIKRTSLVVTSYRSIYDKVYSQLLCCTRDTATADYSVISDVPFTSARLSLLRPVTRCLTTVVPTVKNLNQTRALI